MAVRLSPETLRELWLYIDGQDSNAELDDWLTQAEYDRSIPQEERDALATIRLVLIEASEDSLDPNAVLESVATVLALAQPSKLVIADRSGSNTSWDQPPSLTATPSRPQRVGI